MSCFDRLLLLIDLGLALSHKNPTLQLTFIDFVIYDTFRNVETCCSVVKYDVKMCSFLSITITTGNTLKTTPCTFLLKNNTVPFAILDLFQIQYILNVVTVYRSLNYYTVCCFVLCCFQKQNVTKMCNNILCTKLKAMS